MLGTMILYRRSVIILSVLLFLASCNGPGDANKYTIHRGEFQASLTETGELQAVVAKHIVMPFLGWKYGYMNKITGMMEHGSEVEEGDSIISLDPSSVMKLLVEHETNLEMEKAALNKLRVEHSNREKELLSQLQQQEASYQMEKLELEKSQFDSESNKKIQDLEFKKAEIALHKTRSSIVFNEKIAIYGRQIQEIKVSQLENEIKNAHYALEKLILRSPNKGILQIEYNRRTSQLFKVGDESYPNRSLASIPDLRRMRVKTSVNEVDIGKVKIGQKVIVRLDAFPDLEFTGKIHAIGKLSHEKERESNIKIFDLVVMIEGNNDGTLKPGMTVSCEIIYAMLQDVHYIPNECLLRENGEYFIQVRENGNTAKIPVEPGPRNNNYTVLYGSFQKGQAVMPQQTIARMEK
jgi:multidrug efflux pump subunit AcrA (membrane-fusion protein)